MNRNSSRIRRNVRRTAYLLAIALCTTAPAFAQWPQWGGPHRDFKVDGSKLADHWPKDGPRRLWSRDLGGGYSSILVENGTLYTMYRKGDQEAVVALSASDGKTKWEHAYRAEPYKETKLDFGKGPNGTPLLTAGRLYTVGFTGIMHCLDAKTGKLRWTHDLVKDFEGKIHEFGYSCSPLAYKKNVIVLAGGKNGVIAFDAATGKVAWKSEPFDISYASPILIHIGDEDQIVFMSSTEVIGVSVEDGALRWRYPHKNQYKNNCFMPIWDEAGARLFITAHTDAGTRVLHIHKDKASWKADEVWFDQKSKMFHSNGMIVGDYVYGCLGDQPPTFLTAIRLKDGNVMWKERGFPKANMVFADGKLIVLDEDGQLGLVKVSPEKCEVISKVQLLDKVAWTAPTLVGDRLYVRDQKKIMALNVGTHAD